MRIDKKLVEMGLFQTRTKAQDAIKNGYIYVNDKQILQSSFVYTDGKIDIIEEAYKYVSRGGYKLEKAIEYFKLDFKDSIVMDIGASTGGFTDCSLKHQAKKVIAIDVGSNQLDKSLKSDSRVLSLEQTNFLEIEDIYDNDYFVMDVSFISITKLLPKIKQMMNDKRKLITLIKPQFEAGKINFKNGVLNDKKKHEEILKEILNFASSLGFILKGITYSPIKGKSGNIEYLAYFANDGKSISVDIKRLVCDALTGVV